eukprot:4485529-Heterocapsa_arctica.AAC.1
MAEGVSQAIGSITRLFTRRPQDARGSGANSSEIHPLEVFPPLSTTDLNIPPPPRRSSAGR